MRDHQVKHLFRAIKKNDLTKIEEILADGCDVYAKNSKNDHAFFNALGYGRVDCVELFINYGADVHKISDGGMSTVSRAIQSGNPECIRFLLDKGVDVSGKNGDRALVQVLLTPANYDPIADKQMLLMILEKGANPNMTAEVGSEYSALSWAVLRSRLYAIEPLMQYGADINGQDHDGNTPIMMVLTQAIAQHSDRVNENCFTKLTLLLNYNPDIDTVKNNQGHTALDLVSQLKDQDDRVKKLFEAHQQKVSLTTLINQVPTNDESGVLAL